ncbi:hypothetical protein [Streptomyces triculaminicus]|uniref:hypothetical protein n=1 Tax=Streptomyces triculaminicus TaxID=2816232 RepID=UPI0037D7D02E
MHAWALFDVEDTCADAVFQAALRAAHASADPALGSHVLAFWAIADPGCVVAGGRSGSAGHR